MLSRAILLFVPIALGLGAMAYWFWPKPLGPDPATVNAAYGTPLTPPPGPLRVFHLGHSLVGRDMPAMLAQLAGKGHRYDSQLGWGTSLREHWEPDLAINGFEASNDHPRFRPAEEAIASGEYDAVILTEMVEIKDAIKYHDSAAYLTRWADLARQSAPRTQVYLYETWHWLDDPDGWLNRLENDLGPYWEDAILLPDLMVSGTHRPVRMIPAGQVMSRFVRKLEALGGVDNIPDRTALFAVEPGGKQDQIHMSDLGAYLVALTHYAVLYHRSPVGLPRQLLRADGTPAIAPGQAAARLMQQTVWEVVSAYAKSGVAP